jgi:hypothetical protein
VNRLAILALVPLIAACNVQTKEANGRDDNVSINADANGKLAFDLPFAKGEVKLPASMMSKGNIDIDGVKLMPGSKVTGFSLHGGDKGSTVRMGFSAPAAPDAVRAYYADQFRKEGGKVQLAGDSVTGTSKDGSPFTIRVTPAAGGSNGTIEVQDKG